MDLPSTFVASIPNGRVYDQGYVFTPDNILLGDVSRYIINNEHDLDTSRHPLLRIGELPPARTIRGRVAVLATLSGRGFYHWMFDVLPRVEILRVGGVNLETIDAFYVNECVAAFHFATLEAVGIGRNKVLQNQWNPHVQAEVLIVPSHAGQLSATPRWACDFLRRHLGPKGARLPDSGPQRIYIHRENNTHRKVINQPEITALLVKFGFTVIDPETYSLPEQAALFSAARVIVGPHGSGLANLV